MLFQKQFWKDLKNTSQTLFHFQIFSKIKFTKTSFRSPVFYKAGGVKALSLRSGLVPDQTHGILADPVADLAVKDIGTAVHGPEP